MTMTQIVVISVAATLTSVFLASIHGWKGGMPTYGRGDRLRIPIDLLIAIVGFVWIARYRSHTSPVQIGTTIGACAYYVQQVASITQRLRQRAINRYGHANVVQLLKDAIAARAWERNNKKSGVIAWKWDEINKRWYLANDPNWTLTPDDDGCFVIRHKNCVAGGGDFEHASMIAEIEAGVRKAPAKPINQHSDCEIN